MSHPGDPDSAQKACDGRRMRGKIVTGVNKMTVENG